VKLVDSSLVALQSQSRFQSSHGGLPNGDAKHNGLVTPPSPRSLSSDSNRPRMRKRRSGSSRGRSGSRSRSPDMNVATLPEDLISKCKSASGMASPTSGSLPFSPEVGKEEGRGERSLATPEPSVHTMSSSTNSVEVDSSAVPSVVSSEKGGLTQRSPELEDLVCLSVHLLHKLLTFWCVTLQHPMNVQTAVGVLVLSVAAAAVIWRVKPE
jgi:hypothetical protein